MRWFFVGLVILLLVEWPLRWATEPTEYQGDLAVVHKRDRWTGQSWVATGGEEKPVPSAGQVEEFREEILSGSEMQQRVRELEEQLKARRQVQAENLAGYKQYELIMDETRKKFNKQHAGFIVAGLDLEKPGLSPNEQEFVRGARNKLTENTVAQHRTYIQAARDIKQISKKLETIPVKAGAMAEQKAAQKAYRLRLNLSFGWSITLALSTLAAIAGFLVKRRRSNK